MNTDPTGLPRGACLPVALALLAGCSHPRPPSAPLHAGSSVEPGSRRDAVLTLKATTEATGEGLTYIGDRWRLTVPGDAGWRLEPDPASTLRLTREADGVTVVLRLRVYAIRPGMEPRTFLAAHAMWLAEENEPRIEYTWDKDLAAWQGYSVGQARETYYVFRIEGDRAYVLEESAEGGALGARAADEFQRVAAEFQCAPRSRRTPAPH